MKPAFRSRASRLLNITVPDHPDRAQSCGTPPMRPHPTRETLLADLASLARAEWANRRTRDLLEQRLAQL